MILWEALTGLYAWPSADAVTCIECECTAMSGDPRHNGIRWFDRRLGLSRAADRQLCGRSITVQPRECRLHRG
jgi:hypothetical protein